MTIEFPISLIDPSENDSSPYRWPIGFFFALVAIPFVAVWLITQGPKTYERLNPTFSVLSLGEVSDHDLGIVVRNVTIRKNHACETPGLIYLSGTYQDGRFTSEVLMGADQIVTGNPLVLKKIIRDGETFIIPEMRFIVSKALLAKMEHFRFMLPCKLPLIGEVSAYTNTFDIN
jgi:hypothetical protein